MSNNLLVQKASGEKIGYSRDQLMESLLRAGASAMVAEQITRAVEGKVIEGLSTQRIWQLAHDALRRKEKATALRYGLKRAIMRLGPTGFPFEQYIGAILRAYDYQEVEVGTIIPGNCVNHEVDVAAKKDGKHFIIEAKYHNAPGLRSDVKVALYTYARFQDIRTAWEKNPGHTAEFHEAWLVTNTKCTSDAIQYGNCMGLKILSWRYPTSGGLEMLIEQKQLYPITILPLDAMTKKKFVDVNMMLARDLLTADLEGFGREHNIPITVLLSLKQKAAEIC